MTSRRVQILAASMCVLAGVLLVRLFQLQIVEGAGYYERTENRKRWRTSLPAMRGRILFRDGEVAARDRMRYDLLVIPKEIQDSMALAGFLQITKERLDQGLAEIEKQIARKAEQERSENGRRLRTLIERRRPQVLLSDIDPETMIRIDTRRQEFPELSIEVATDREYPEKEVAGHVVGYMTAISRDDIAKWTAERSDGTRPTMWEALSEQGLLLTDRLGRAGIEKQYDGILRGKRGIREVEKNHRGAFVRTLQEEPAKAGEDIHLTLSLPLQKAAEQALSGHTGSLVLIDVRTGDLLALASNPRPDPKAFSDSVRYGQLRDDPKKPLLHRAVAGALPPGSIFKIVTTIAGMEGEVLRQNTVHTCHQRYIPRSNSYKCLGWHNDIQLNVAIKKSCNIYFYNVADDLYAQNPTMLPFWAGALGFGRKTGIDIPGERTGWVPRQRLRKGDHRNLSIGQGDLQVTSLQVAGLFATIGTGGNRPQPRLSTRSPVKIRKIPFSPKTLAALRDGLDRVVHETGGTAASKYRAVQPGVRIHGKTGTAQAGRGPNHAWFGGYAPTDSPEIAFAIVWEREQGGVHGSDAAHNLFQVIKLWNEKVR